MSYRTKTLMFLALAAIVFFCGAAGGWLAQGMLKDAEIANLKAEHSAQDLAVTNQALADSASFQKGIYDALQTAIILGQQNATAAASMQNSLAGVQSVVKRLSGDFAGLPDKLSGTTREAAIEYAIACTAVFQSVAASAGQLAEDAGRIARQADGHAADAATLDAGWPKRAGQ